MADRHNETSPEQLCAHCAHELQNTQVPDNQRTHFTGIPQEAKPERDPSFFFHLVSRNDGRIPVLGAFPTCDIGQFPSLYRCESHRIVWSPLDPMAFAPIDRKSTRLN